MSPSDSVRARLGRLLVEARTEVESVQRIADELAESRAALDEAEPGRPIMALVAVDLHDYFTAAESFFERVARLVDGEVPGGPDSHQALIDQMAAELPPLRGAVLDEDLRRALHELRRFRQFFRHAYAVALDAPHLRRHAETLTAHHSRLLAAMQAVLDRARAARDTLATD